MNVVIMKKDKPHLQFEVCEIDDGRTVLVLNEEQTRALRAANQREYEKRLQRTKYARANIFC